MANAKLFECIPSDMASLERVRYFPRMLITPDDMTAEQAYLRNKLRRHNRLLHGWGVVCGCEVTPGEKEFEVKITPGYVLGPYGDEIIIWKELAYDIRTELVCGCTVEYGNGLHQIDPWCGDVKKKTMSGQTYYVAVKYKEIETRPVRAHPVGCSCEQSHCESSRILDSFMIKALTELPPSHIGEPPEIGSVINGERNCTPCPLESWVVLAKVVPKNDGEILYCDIDNCSHRRWVLSIANFWWRCKEMPKIDAIEPNIMEKSDDPVKVTITGCNYVHEGDQVTNVDFGEDVGVIVDPQDPQSETTLIVQLDLSDADVGFKDVTVTNPDGQSATLINGFEVIESSKLIKSPILSRVFPMKIELGKTQKVNISGRNFMKGVSLNFGTGITVSDTIFRSYRELIVTLKIDPSAQPGAKEISITNPGQPEKIFENLFTVIAAKKTKDPIVERIIPAKLKPGEEAIIKIEGNNFVDGLGVDFGKPEKSKISLKEIVSITDNEVHLKIKVWKNAKSGPRELSLTNPGGKPISIPVDLEIETSE